MICRCGRRLSQATWERYGPGRDREVVVDPTWRHVDDGSVACAEPCRWGDEHPFPAACWVDEW